MSSEYQVIARKWRPRKFSDMVGQEHIVATLKNAIRQQRTAHAYLFVGPRGIGKTTSARIFAKALNCQAPEDGEPCCKCQSCVAIANENSIDVIEIDAASQNSVDNIRDLREEVMHVPVNSRYKIYIIDEVHMLSKQAWNALLKTVEEPPKHAKFIFATTEVHQVLPTIISRCQRFDLQRLTTRQITGRLQEIAANEKVNISPAAISAIARAADGGMRDAQSLLDQMISFFNSDASTPISEAQVLSLFGLTASDEIEKLLHCIFANDKGGVVANIHTLASRGKNLETLFADILAFMRGIELCQLLANPENILETGDDTIAVYKKFAAAVRPDVVQRMLEALAPVGRTLHDAINKQIFLETIILKSMRDAHSLQIDDLIAHINHIRNGGELDALKTMPPVTTPVYVPTLVPPVENNSPAREVVQNIQPQVTPEAPQAIIETKAEVTPEAPQAIIETKPEVTPEAPQAVAEIKADITAEPEAVPEPQPSPVVDDHPELIHVPDTLSVKESYRVAEEINGSEPAIVVEGIEPIDTIPPESGTDNDADSVTEEPSASVDVPPVEKLPDDLINPAGLWHALIAAAGKSLPDQTLQLMRQGSPESFIDSQLIVCFDEEYANDSLQELNASTHMLQTLLAGLAGIPAATLVIQTRQGVRELGGKPQRMPEDLRRAVESNPFVQEVLDLFGGEVVDAHG